MALFFMLGWDRYGFKKKHTRTCCSQLVFLHPLGSVGHVEHSDVSAARNVIAQFFILVLDWYGFDKTHTWTRYGELVFWHLVRFAGHAMHSSASGARNIDALFLMLGGPGTVSIKNTPGHITPNLFFCFPWDQRVT
jgi:hypothetical protein